MNPAYNPVFKRIHPVLFNAIRDYQLALGRKVAIYIDNEILESEVLRPYESDNRVVSINVSPQALTYLDVTDAGIAFGASFNGVPHDLAVSWPAIEAICAFQTHHRIVTPVADGVFCKEDGTLMVFTFPDYLTEEQLQAMNEAVAAVVDDSGAPRPGPLDRLDIPAPPPTPETPTNVTNVNFKAKRILD